MEQVYKINVGCRNCLKIDEVEIQYGKLVTETIPNKICKFCGNNKVLEQIQIQKGDEK